MRPEPLEETRKPLSKLLTRSNKALPDGLQLSEAITGDGGHIFRHACGLGLEGILSKRIGSRYVSCPCRKSYPDVMMVQPADDRQRE